MDKPIRYKLGTWYQIGGDMNPAKHGIVLGKITDAARYPGWENVRDEGRRLSALGLDVVRGNVHNYQTAIVQIDNLLDCCGNDAFEGDDPFAVTERSFSDRELRDALRSDKGWFSSCDVDSWLSDVWPEAYADPGFGGPFNPDARLTHRARLAIAESIVSYSGGASTTGGPEVCPATFSTRGFRTTYVPYGQTEQVKHVWRGSGPCWLRSGRRDGGFYKEARTFAREKREHEGK